MAVFLPDPFDDWSTILEEPVMRAMSIWLDDHVLPNVFRTLVAAADDEEVMPNIEAILAAAAAWDLVLAQEMTPTQIGLIAARVAAMTDARGVDVAALPRAAGLRDELADALDEAMVAMTRAGVSTGQMAVIIDTATWVDFIDDYARAAVNRVSGMPESVYREMVQTLAKAVKDGMNPQDRAALVRDFLDLDDPAQYERWRRRAQTIARTETNSLINAADLQAGRMEQQLTGEEMHKAWVCTLDRRTRDSHFKADGQRVPLDGKFTIGGHECDHPGDQHLPAHETINCRCTTVLLEADEPLPDETDRQTERERADGTRREPQAEVRRRAADGVTRARDDAPQTVTAAMKEKPMRTTWSGVLAPIDKPTGDGRIIDSDAVIEFREFPLPLMFQRATSSGHDTAVVVGKIAAAVVEGGAIHATGELFDTDDAGEARELLSEGVIRPSVDMCDMVVDFTVVDGDGKKVDPEVDEWDPSWSETMHVRSATIMAATLVSKPAFAEAKIVLGDEVVSPDDAEEETAALVASAVALAPVDAAVDSAAFADPGLDGPTALTVTDDGRVFGHLALWGTEHVGIGRGVTPPHSNTGYALFHVSTVTTDEGPVSVGRLTVGCGHAGPRDGAHAATAHYDETGTCWALVRAGEDAHGIWVAGIINPDADTATVRAGASAPLSGDWRAVGGNLELVAALSVNTPGFPVPRSYVAAEGAEMSLVAAAVVPRRSRADELADAVAEGLRRHEARRAAAEATEARTVEARRMAAALLAGGIQ